MIRHRRAASQALPSRPIKKERFEVSERVLMGLQHIYHDMHAQPRCEGQASALKLVHHPTPRRPLVIVLPTSSGKSALFFSVAAMTHQQTVIVVIPFAALVDDIIERGQAAGLDCEEWLDESSGHELQQLIVVSADRAVSGAFLHYAKGLELAGQLAHVFFDEVHVAITDTSYRERLRELWQLRYLNCPFTGLTATLMIALEGTLKANLSIEHCQIFRRPTARRTIQYQVWDSRDEAPSDIAIKYVQETRLPPGQKGVIYVRSYDTGRGIRDALGCPFYQARAENKSQVLQEWVGSDSGWIVATGALGTGVNIEGIRYVIHVSRPYGLTSFVQQSGRSGRNGEVSKSIIITRVQNSQGQKREGIMSAYTVEQIDEDAMTEFIQAQTCRREVLCRHMDIIEGPSDCMSTDSVLCDICQRQRWIRHEPYHPPHDIKREDGIQVKEEEGESHGHASPSGRHGAQMIHERFQAMEAWDEQMAEVMTQLQGSCIYCQLIYQEPRAPHGYPTCEQAQAQACGPVAYQTWRTEVDLGAHEHCWKCGLGQQVCRRLENDGWCEFPDIMLPSIFVLYQKGYLEQVVSEAGFQGLYPEDIWEWMNEKREIGGGRWESNWMVTWRMVCQFYRQMKG